jgi:hypothetical protein
MCLLPLNRILKNGCSWALWLLPVILATWKAEIRRIANFRPVWASSQDPISKITKAKWTGGLGSSSSVPALQGKALNSNSSTTKKKKEL